MFRIKQELDYHVTAERYLLKQLSKTKRIAESSAFNEFKGSKNISSEGPKNIAESNVLARLFKSNPVKHVLPDIMAGIRKLLGLEEMPSGKQNKPESAKDASQTEKSMRQLQSQQLEAESELDSEPEENAPGDEKSHYSSQEEDPAMADEDSSENEDFSHGHKRDQLDLSYLKTSKVPTHNTTFLPSLMMGGYWSGSEGEATDDEAMAGPPRRKNRMGQQARRALWEKKYGTKANHIQKDIKKMSRDSGWDTKRGATDAGDRGRKGKHAGRAGFGSQSRRDGDAEPNSASGPSRGVKGKGVSQDAGPLHPSWEAKRRAKEQAATASFQGKKVVFD